MRRRRPQKVQKDQNTITSSCQRNTLWYEAERGGPGGKSKEKGGKEKKEEEMRSR